MTNNISSTDFASSKVTSSQRRDEQGSKGAMVSSEAGKVVKQDGHSTQSPTVKVDITADALSLKKREEEAEAKANANAQAADKEDSPLSLAVAKLEEHVQTIQRDLSFRIDGGSGDVVVTVLDAKTEEVIRQIPSEEAIELSSELSGLTTLFVDSQA